ncbi:hypothetical protein A33Q_2966 [Indibacter alkaliphilus LW1]|jgi:hypothetical protein|uniref:Protein required for attachment to host cells n=1 Tax=Indibacter alkaliphilus (strain CCUG 57479 / KCTC 22604 / LW1) TaxID=1189612 RepID=S2D9R0_INDAL|nr:hypothetical protein [Indibacter alkaliphilus]EOZ95604.1 hypothetical protein A33Q_2966 [Indibacter alkaliphilus LW1]
MSEKAFKQIGLWIDHNKAHIIGYDEGHVKLIETVESPVEALKREAGEGNDSTRFTSNNNHTSNNEYKKHNVSQNELKEYFKILENKLHPYEDILLFGPGTAKEQIRNRLREIKSFDKKWLSIQKSDRLTENQLLAFVRDFYKDEFPSISPGF